MSADPQATFDDVAYHWEKFGPPLRPSDEDVRIMLDVVRRWLDDPSRLLNVLLLGVTPELATMTWPCPINLTALDHSESMVRVVWPGDVPDVRQAFVRSWLSPGLDPGSQDVIIGDGGYGFFDFPKGQRTLTSVLRPLTRPGGLFIYRMHAQAPVRESLVDVLAAARSGAIGSFHAFKWRAAMALQPDSTSGVRLHDVWQAWADAEIDAARLPQPGWSEDAVETIRFYRAKDGRYFFPTVAEFRGLLGEFFDDATIEVHIPGYEIGDRRPILSARVNAVHRT